MESSINIEQDYQIWILLAQADVAISRGIQNELRQIGVSEMQLGVLAILKMSKIPLSPMEISKWIFREPHSVSALLKRMEKNGLIRMESDEVKKRSIRLIVTDKGDQIFRQATQVKGITKVMSCLSSREKKSFQKYLLTLRDTAVDELAKKPQLPFPF